MPLSMNEYQVLTMLPRGASHPITVNDISRVTHVDERTVRDIISSLIRVYGVPIVAMRHGNTGMFIATDDEERNIGIASYKSQIGTMQERVRLIERADLNGWERALQPEIKLLVKSIEREGHSNDTAS